MAFEGRLEGFSIRNVVAMLASNHRSGLLLVRGHSSSGAICFRKGKITSASGGGTPRLGDWLVERGKLSKDSLASAIEQHRREDNRRSLGKVLVDDWQVLRDDLRECAILQIENVLKLLFSWKEGSFHFGSGRMKGQVEVEVSLPTACEMFGTSEAIDSSVSTSRLDGRPRVVAIGLNEILKRELEEGLTTGGFELLSSEMDDQAWTLFSEEMVPSEVSLLVINFCSEGESQAHAWRLLAQVRRLHPRLSVALLIPLEDFESLSMEAYRLGVRAALPGPRAVASGGGIRPLAAALCAISCQVWREAETGW